MSKLQRTIKIVYDELCEIDTKFVNYFPNIKTIGSAILPSDYLLPLIKDASPNMQKVIIASIIRGCTVAYNKILITQLMILYPYTIKWLFMKGIIGTFGTPLDIMNDKKYMLTVSAYNGEDEDVPIDVSAIDYFIDMVSNLNNANTIKAIKNLNVSNDQKINILCKLLDNDDSNDEDIIENIKDMDGIEKLYHDGTLRLTDKAYCAFSNELCNKIFTMPEH